MNVSPHVREGRGAFALAAAIVPGSADDFPFGIARRRTAAAKNLRNEEAIVMGPRYKMRDISDGADDVRRGAAGAIAEVAQSQTESGKMAFVCRWHSSAYGLRKASPT